MKRRIICFLLTFVLILSICCSLNAFAATYSLVEDTAKAYEVVPGANYHEYTITSGVNGNYVLASGLQFSNDDYMVLPYSGTASGAGTLDEHYQRAVAEGYDVVALINGDFFSMDSGATPNGNYGYPNEYLVSNGRIFFCDNDNAASDFGGVVAINSDGSVTSTPKSTIHFNMYINGEEVPNGLAHINKTSGKNSASTWGDQFYYFDEHAGDLYYAGNKTGVAMTYAICPGYEILCEKINHTDLTIGGTLEAQVLSVKENTYGGAIGENQFILFVKANSSKADYAKNVKAGDTITISASETVTAASEVTADSLSLMANVGWLVKDGVDRTQIDATIGSHDVTLQARWTCFGKKADGSWVFFTTEGASTGSNGSVTLRDVAKAMISFGCTDVIRMDGGGSSAMYVCDDGSGNPGFKQKSTRDVCDCILVVKRSSAALAIDSALKTTVQTLNEQAKRSNDIYADQASKFATAVLANEKAVKGDYLLAYMKLRYALSGKSELGELMGNVANVSYKDYSEFVLTNLRDAYRKASAAFGGSNDADEIKTAYDELNKWYQASGPYTDGKETYETVSKAAYVTAFNTSILTGYCSIFTPGIDFTKVNLKWSQVTVLQWDKAQKGYVVTQNFFPSGNDVTVQKKLNFENNIIPEGFIVIGTHGDDGESSKNKSFVATNAKVGKVLKLYGADIETKTLGVATYFTFADPLPTYIRGDVDGNGAVETKDYIKLKRYVLGTYKTDDAEEIERMNVDQKGGVDSKDYVMLKRVVLGTYAF